MNLLDDALQSERGLLQKPLVVVGTLSLVSAGVVVSNLADAWEIELLRDILFNCLSTFFFCAGFCAFGEFAIRTEVENIQRAAAENVGVVDAKKLLLWRRVELCITIFTLIFYFAFPAWDGIKAMGQESARLTKNFERLEEEAERLKKERDELIEKAQRNDKVDAYLRIQMCKSYVALKNKGADVSDIEVAQIKEGFKCADVLAEAAKPNTDK
jgi:hypothetical protein